MTAIVVGREQQQLYAAGTPPISARPYVSEVQHMTGYCLSYVSEVGPCSGYVSEVDNVQSMWPRLSSCSSVPPWGYLGPHLPQAGILPASAQKPALYT